jgi:hypothetical protein
VALGGVVGAWGAAARAVADGTARARPRREERRNRDFMGKVKCHPRDDTRSGVT